MCFYAKSYGITIHNYCLMPNHYHLLIEVKRGTLSKYMRQLNMNYAIYFNKKQKRTGHLWQGRFKSWYVTDEAYLYTLILYIEHNHLKAGIVNTPEAYPYSSAHYFLSDEVPECLQDSWTVQNFRQEEKEAIREFLHTRPDIGQLSEMKKAASLIEASNIDKKPDIDKLKKMFEGIMDIQKRNRQILKAIERGYSQHSIAKVLGISQPAVCGVIKRNRG
jgi:REP element-mobilizing transposase RayT/O6-methylguanine-DNA--protein-cysteine methyltransferase